jgi:hypothetical protein
MRTAVDREYGTGDEVGVDHGGHRPGDVGGQGNSAERRAAGRRVEQAASRLLGNPVPRARGGGPRRPWYNSPGIWDVKVHYDF